VKIISIGPAHPLRGGIADFNERLTKELVMQGHTASIVSYSLQYPSFLFPGKTQFADYPAPTNISIETKINSINPFNWIKVGKQIQKENADLIFIHYWLPFFGPALGKIGRIIKKNSKTKVVAICHNLIPHEPKPGDITFTKYFSKICDSFIAMSDSVIKDINQICPTKPTIQSPHPLYDNFGDSVDRNKACEELGLAPQNKYILFFGLVRKYKGLDLLLKSFALLQDTSIKLIVAGEFYDNPESYNSIIKEYSLENRVIIINEFIAQSKVCLYFSCAEIVAQTYLSATQSGITQIAYHFNKPMLVTNVGGLSEIIPHNKVGYVCEKNEQEIANCLTDFFVNNRYNEFAKNVEVEKEKYTWSTFCNRILS